MDQKNTSQKSAALCIIGDEILSGRTIDANLAYIATRLNTHGIALSEVRVVSDQERAIITAVNDLRGSYDFLFTTGGIGPTHDDITSETIAKALELEWVIHSEAFALLDAHYKELNLPFNTARQRMATTPKGASLLRNPISIAPGFKIANVFVMAGVPKIMQAMLEDALNAMEKGKEKSSESVSTRLGEGVIAHELKIIQHNHPRVAIGSYPKFDPEKGLSVTLIASSTDDDELSRTIDDIKSMLARLEPS